MEPRIYPGQFQSQYRFWPQCTSRSIRRVLSRYAQQRPLSVFLSDTSCNQGKAMCWTNSTVLILVIIPILQVILHMLAHAHTQIQAHLTLDVLRRIHICRTLWQQWLFLSPWLTDTVTWETALCPLKKRIAKVFLLEQRQSFTGSVCG